MKVKKIDKSSSFESQKDIVIEGLNAARKLLVIGQKLPNEN